MATAVAHTANKVDRSSSDFMITVPLPARQQLARSSSIVCRFYHVISKQLRAQGANVVAKATDIQKPVARSTLLACEDRRFSWFSDRIIETMSTKPSSKAAKHSAQGKSNAP